MSRMRDSGIAWVGECPDHWEFKRGKYLLCLLQKRVLDNDGIITCFRNGEVTLRSNRREEGFTIAEKEHGYQGVDVGDLVVHGMDGFAGAIGISDSRGKASPVLNVLDTASFMDKKYTMYYLRAMAYGDVFLSLATGIRVRSCDLRWNKLAELRYPVPPLTEQQAIATFLDNKCSEIELLVQNIKKEIEALEEYKRTVITETVTRGFYANVKMKDSGIAWMRICPANWKIKKFKYCFNRRANKNHGHAVVLSLYREHGVIPKDSRDDNHNITSDDTGKYLYVRKGDFVINKMKAWQGSVAVSDYEGIVSPAYYVYEIKSDELIRRYIHYFMRNKALTVEFRRLSGGIREGQWDLPAAALENLLICIPPKEEQQKIAVFLDKKCAEINMIIKGKKEQLLTLDEYKKSLIYEYVTGKKEAPAL